MFRIYLLWLNEDRTVYTLKMLVIEIVFFINIDVFLLNL